MQERPACDCTDVDDEARSRPPTLHQEHCAVNKWWWAQALKINCTRCRRVELVDISHPNFPRFEALPEPRGAVCSKCAILIFEGGL